LSVGVSVRTRSEVALRAEVRDGFGFSCVTVCGAMR
jgi:hypothetical protein